MDDDEAMARHIVHYLRAHPDAADTIEGIAGWWLVRERIAVTTRAITRVVESLCVTGVLVEQRRADGRRLFSLAKDGT